MSNGFFQAIAPIAEHATLNVMVNRLADGKLNVIIIPKPINAAEEKSLSQPLRFTGTPEELDRDLAAGLPQVASGYLSVLETISSIKELQEAEKKDLVEKATTKKSPKPAAKAAAALPAGKSTTKAAKASKTATAPSSDSDDDEGGEGSGGADAGSVGEPSGSQPAASVDQQASPVVAERSLFDIEEK